MALANFTLSSAAGAPPVLPSSPHPLRIDFPDLLYSPADQMPFSQTNPRRPKLRKRAGSTYLPPSNQFAHYPRQEVPLNPYGPSQLHTQVYQQNTRLDENQRVSEANSQEFNTGQYVHDPSGDYGYEQRQTDPNRAGYLDNPYAPATPAPVEQTSSRRFDGDLNQNLANSYFSSPSERPLVQQHPPSQQQPPSQQHLPSQQQPPSQHLLPSQQQTPSHQNAPSPQHPPSQQQPPSPEHPPVDRPPGYTQVESGAGGKTQLHAVLDYDDDYYDDIPVPGVSAPAVTPLQGPILVRNGTVPVVPLTSYSTVNNGSFYQIPILWTALSLALGYELQGQVIRGVPCVKRNYQLYCPTAGNTYPTDKIAKFIDENKALIKRMYGTFSTPGSSRVRRAPGVPDLHQGDSYFRQPRQARPTRLPDPHSGNTTGRMDACESKTEIMTPYWAHNSARKLRAIVNTMHFEQAIHQEVCSKESTRRCSGDCGCEQKYKWHRLLAYDPSDDCAGIFMDWFLFPSCCVCRCKHL